MPENHPIKGYLDCCTLRGREVHEAEEKRGPGNKKIAIK